MALDVTDAHVVFLLPMRFPICRPEWEAYGKQTPASQSNFMRLSDTWCQQVSSDL